MSRREFLQARALLAAVPPFRLFLPLMVGPLPLWRLNVTTLNACVLG